VQHVRTLGPPCRRRRPHPLPLLQSLQWFIVPWDARERRSCTSDYWQVAFPHPLVRKNAQGRRAERYGSGCIRPSENICANWLIINKTGVQIEKKKGKYGIEYSLASASDGPCPRGWGADSGNGVPSPQIFQFNHRVLDPAGPS